jgi:flagellar assembly factor FliW
MNTSAVMEEEIVKPSTRKIRQKRILTPPRKQEKPVEIAPVMLQIRSGLLGFEKYQQYVLTGKTEELPFLWLTSVEKPELKFLVVPSAKAVADYRPEINDADVKLLNLNSSSDAMVLNIVTLRGNGQATINLKGPVVFNRHTLQAKQVILVNAAKYDTQYPLPSV